MVDEINAQNTGGESKFKPHPEGTFAATCVDVIDLGKKVDQWAGKPKIQAKCALVFVSGKINPETQEPHDVSIEFTVSMGDKANLRRFLESWRGKKYTEEQAKIGVPLHKLANQPGMITVEHHESKSGRKYGKILTISPLPEGYPTPPVPTYQRGKFWADRKAAYAEELTRHLATQPTDDGDDYDPAQDDSETPF